MPRDDLSIDFIKGHPMPHLEALDPAQILDDWVNRVANLPEEMRFLEEEISTRDRRMAEHIRTIDDRDGRIQKWIKANGSHQDNPREEGYRVTIRENYAAAEQLAEEKIKLAERMKIIVDKHVRQLDAQIKTLYDRGEPGFADPDEVPSLLRPSAANHSNPISRMSNAVANPTTNAVLQPIMNGSSISAARTNPQIRAAQQSSSAPITPAAGAASSSSRHAREGSTGPNGLKKAPRLNTNLSNTVLSASGLARHSSLGPGTPKATTATGAQRAGSAGPRASTKGGSSSASSLSRRATSATSLGGIARKKAGTTTKSGLSRVKRAAKSTASSNAGSEVSDADDGSVADDSDAGTTGGGGRATPVNSRGAATSHLPMQPHAGVAHLNNKKGGHQIQESIGNNNDEDMMDLDDDEAGDDRKYCLCQNVSHGDMVACDNDSCPFEWFHWSCVGLKSEPTGAWFCPVCTEEAKKKSAK